MSQYDAVAKRALATITRKGAPVVFVGQSSANESLYNPLTDTWTDDPSSSTNLTGSAVQIPGDPDRFSAIGLTMLNSVTLMIAASGLSVTPVAGMVILWAGVNYTIKDVDPLAPNGTPIIYTVIASA